MSEYTPDRWVIAEMNSEHGKIRKVLGSWYGGYAGTDHWRFSSGITKIVEHEKFYEVHNESGSIYTCIKGAEGMSGYTSGILMNMQKKALQANATIEIVNILEGAEIHSDKDYKVGTLEQAEEFTRKRNYEID